jgi:ribose transport system ATP-binding protein
MTDSVPASEMLLEMRGVEKRFPGVHALKGIDLDLASGEVLALMGENGAGKSTLIKVLGGAHAPDAGVVKVQGQDVSIHTPSDAQAAGVGIIYQEFNLVPYLTARENIFLGQERTRWGFCSRREEHRRARELFNRIGVDVDPEAVCSSLSVAQQQCVEIAKALSLDAKLLVMDEPSATLTPQEVEKLFDIIRDLKAQGIGIIYVSHRLDEIFAITDRIMVMRDGAYIGTSPTAETSREQLIEMMVGRPLEQEFPKEAAELGEERLVVSGLCRGSAVQDVSFSVRRGEIVGFTGLVGAGRTETMRLLFGADRKEAGSIRLDGKELSIGSPRAAIAAGICLLTEDRKNQGLVLGLSVRENFALPNLGKFSRRGFMDKAAEGRRFDHYQEAMAIKVPHREQLAKNLSGGNQQKVVLAKWLESNSEVVIFDEPTRGIDVGAKVEIYRLMNRLAAEGKAIIMISSELPEVLGMADRIVVMHEGRITGEVSDVAGTTQEQIMALAVG